LDYCYLLCHKLAASACASEKLPLEDQYRLPHKNKILLSRERSKPIRSEKKRKQKAKPDAIVLVNYFNNTIIIGIGDG
jgi:hypothetical protein